MPRGLPLRALPLFFFLHIQKTAGTSIRTVLNQMFAPYSLFTTPPEVLALSRQAGQKIWTDPEFYAKYLLIGGHVQFDHPIVRSDVPRRRKIYMAVLRDPVARAVSHYDYIRRNPRHWLHQELLQKSLFEAFTSSEKFRKIHIDEQLRIAFGTESPTEAEDVIARNNFVLSSMSTLEKFVDVISALSGLARPARFPRKNASEPGGAQTLELACEQPDHEAAISLIREANRREEEFIARHLKDVLVHTSLTPSVVPMRAVR